MVDSNSKGVEFLFKKNKVTGIHGLGRITGPNEVEVEGPDGAKTTYGAKNIMIATGSVPRDVPIAPTDGERILNSDHILELKKVPQSLAVLGAGAVGTEFASIYTSFGSKVTLIEMLPRILPIEDEEVSAELQKALRKRGIDVMTGTKMLGVERTENGVRLQARGGEDRHRRGRAAAGRHRPPAGDREPEPRGAGHRARARLRQGQSVHADRACRTSTPSAT